jgi:hypothetical protein
MEPRSWGLPDMGTAEDLTAQAARAISPIHASKLVKPLQVLAGLARKAHARTRNSPSRREARQKLAAIRNSTAGSPDFASPALAPFRDTLRRQKGRRALPETADWLAEYISPGGGASNLMDSLGAPRAPLLIASGVVILFASANGQWPSQNNYSVAKVCALVAEIAGLGIAQQDSLAGWERHLKDARQIHLRTGKIPSDKVLGAQMEIVGAWQGAGVWDLIYYRRFFNSVPRQRDKRDATRPSGARLEDQMTMTTELGLSLAVELPEELQEILIRISQTREVHRG